MAKSKKAKRWARGSLSDAVSKALRKPKTVSQVAKELGAHPLSVRKAVYRVGRGTGKTVEGPTGHSAVLYKRA